MLCTTRGLCKVVGLDRPAADELEELTNTAFASIDRDSSGQISLAEFSDWILHERSVVAYLTRFASTRVIYENQVLYDTLLKQLCTLFVEYAVSLGVHGGSGASSKHLACSTGTCREIIVRACSAAAPREVEYLVSTMQTCMTRKYQHTVHRHEQTTDTDDAKDSKEADAPETSLPACNLPTMINMDVFCTVMSPYVAFVAADEDSQHQIDMRELRVLLWLIRGKEPAPAIVDSIMKSLDRDHNGVLSVLEWVSYALENDRRTGNLSFTTQMQLPFTRADQNKDAALTLPELSAGLNEILMAVIDTNSSNDDPNNASDGAVSSHNAAAAEHGGGGERSTRVRSCRPQREGARIGAAACCVDSRRASRSATSWRGLRTSLCWRWTRTSRARSSGTSPGRTSTTSSSASTRPRSIFASTFSSAKAITTERRLLFCLLVCALYFVC